MYVQRLGLVPYLPTWDLQEQLLADTLAIKTQNRAAEAAALPQPTPNHLLFCQHPPTYTLGKSGKPKHLLLNEAGLAAHGATFHLINRGGDITFHGPGQLVAYPLLDLENFRPDIHWYLAGAGGGRWFKPWPPTACGRATSRASPACVAGLGSTARLPPAKICAMGVRCSRWVTLHGLAPQCERRPQLLRPHRALRHHRQGRDLPAKRAGPGRARGRGGRSGCWPNFCGSSTRG
ncbi:MAG: lipoyl(octanoyl) transferase [Hymenobacter sp.]